MNHTITVEPPATKDGGIEYLTVNYCKKINISGSVRTSFVSTTTEVFQPIGAEQLPKGCQTIKVPVIIPLDLPAAKYYIHFRATYKLNPLRSVTEDFTTNTFQVQ
jgi:hypothetical protein